MKVVFSRAGLLSAIEPDRNCKPLDKLNLREDEYEVVKSVYLKRSGIETKLIVSEEILPPAHPETVKAIQNAVSKALSWNDALITGQVASMTELAKQEEVV